MRGVKNMVLRVVTTCRLVEGKRRFGGTFYLAASRIWTLLWHIQECW